MLAGVVYVVLLAASAACTYAACLPGAVAFGALALFIALRYELRWVADHTRLTHHRPRPVPKP